MNTKQTDRDRTPRAIFLSLSIAATAFGCWLAEPLFSEAYRDMQANDAWRQKLLQASKKSETHQYFVHHWMQCRPIVSTRASCLSSIRSAAAVRGEAFLGKVDAVAVELGLA